MSNNERSRNNDGEFHRKRRDTKVQTLKETYSEFDNINGNTHLGTLMDKYNADSLNDVLKALRKEQKR